MTSRGRRKLFAAEQSGDPNDSNANASSDIEILESSLLNNKNDHDFNWIKTPKNEKRRNKKLSEIEKPKAPEEKGRKLSLVKATRVSQSPVCEGFKKSSPLMKSRGPKSPLNALPMGVKQGTIALKGSRRRNVEAWLAASNDNNKEIRTPPMELSPPPSGRTPDCVDPTVAEVLKAIYGPDWRNAGSKRKSKTDVKLPPKQPSTFSTDVKQPGSRSSLPKCARKIFADSPIGILKTPVNRKSNDSVSLKRRLLSVDIDSESPVHVDAKKRRVSPRAQPPNSAQKTPCRTFLASLSVSTPTSVGHPEARNYKINFSKTKDELCARLFKLYNSEVFDGKLPDDMGITWNAKMRGTAGFCYNKRRRVNGEIIRSARIELAPKVVDRADRLRDTLIHELCHAAAWIIDGVINGHGAPWQVWTRKAIARFPELPRVTKCHNYEIASKFTYRCTECSYSINRQTKSIDIDRKRCGYCLGKLELLYNKKKRGETEEPEFDTTRTVKAPNAFGIFVKENYKRIKEFNPDKKHGEIMKLLSQEYAVFKAVTTPKSNAVKPRKSKGTGEL